MKLRLLPILVSLVVTSAVLFGGWFAYHSVAMETPLSETIHDIEGVKNAEMNLDSDTLTLELTLERDANLYDIMQQIRKDGKAIIKDRKINVKINNHSSPELDAWWSLMLFDVAEAMENREYSSIPESLHEKKSSLGGLVVATSMDEENVYVRLARGEHSKYIVLPRTAPQMGVWPNE